MAGIKSRSYTVTVNIGHVCDDKEPSAGAEQPPAAKGEGDPLPPSILLDNWLTWLDSLSEAYEAGSVDYAIISAELSKTNRPHLNGFVVFNEECEDKPTELISGHWLKARNLSGSRDYCAKAGIHIGKPGVLDTIEFGEWIDPGWNQSLRSRLIYDSAFRLKRGQTLERLCAERPEVVLLVGLHNLRDVRDSALKARYADDGAESTAGTEQYFSPYCYIGRTETEARVRNSVSWRAMESRAGKLDEESE